MAEPRRVVLTATKVAVKHRWIGRVLVSVVCGLLLVEGGLRLVRGGDFPFLGQWANRVEFLEERANRNFEVGGRKFTYDGSGFRTGSGLPFDRSVLFIGDSFTEGRGVNDQETFARAAERALRREGLAVRTLNAGHHGFGAAQEWVLMQRLLAHHAVDAIVVQSFPMNDLSDNLSDGHFGIEGGRLVRYASPRPPVPAQVARIVGESWLRHLYLARAVCNAMVPADLAAPYTSHDALDLERALLREIVATARARHIPLVFLVVPTRRVQESYGRVVSRKIPEIERFYGVRDAIATSGVPWLDAGEVIPDLWADAQTGDRGHFGREGNRLVGEALARQLKPLLSPRAGSTTTHGRERAFPGRAYGDSQRIPPAIHAWVCAFHSIRPPGTNPSSRRLSGS